MKEKHEATESSKFMMDLEEIGILTDKVQRNLSVESLMDRSTFGCNWQVYR